MSWYRGRLGIYEIRLRERSVFVDAGPPEPTVMIGRPVLIGESSRSLIVANPSSMRDVCEPKLVNTML